MSDAQTVELRYRSEEGLVRFRVDLSVKSIAKLIPFMEELAEEDEE